jgi:hypothetical protein
MLLFRAITRWAGLRDAPRAARAVQRAHRALLGARARGQAVVDRLLAGEFPGAASPDFAECAARVLRYEVLHAVPQAARVGADDALASLSHLDLRFLSARALVPARYSAPLSPTRHLSSRMISL